MTINKKNKQVKGLLLSVFTVLLLPLFFNLISANCYQESFNSSTVGDGSCSLNYSGSATQHTSGSGIITNGGLFFDKNFSTNATYTNSPTLSEAYVDITYYKPSVVEPVGNVWIIKIDSGSTVTYNFILPSGCLTAYSDRVLVRAYTWENGKMDFRCDSSGVGSFSALLFQSTGIVRNFQLYEEAMDWNVTTPSVSVQFVSPTDENGDSYQRQNILVNVTSNENNITINFYNSTGNLIQSVNNLSSSFFYNYSTGVDGIFYFNATSCNNQSICNSTETRYVQLDTFNPVIDILFPSDILYVGEGYYNYFVNSTNFTAINTGTIATCWIILNGGSPIYVPNCTEGTIMTYTGLSTIEGLNNITIYANDTINLQGFHEHQFYVDTIPPSLQIISPIDSTVYNSVFQLLNISSNGTNIIYSINGVNHTYTEESFVLFNEGINQLDVYSYDLAQNVAISSITFTVNTPVPPPTYQSNVIYMVMNSSGAGLGIFIQFLGQALPLLLIGLALVGIIIAVAWSIKGVLVKAGNP